MTGFALESRLDLERLASEFKGAGRVQVPALVDSNEAQALRQHLLDRADWKLIFNHGDLLYEYDARAQASFTPEQRQSLHTALENAGRTAFQYFYESIRVAEPDGPPAHLPEDLLAAFAAFLNSDPLLEFARRCTGFERIAFADCQATCYRRGHFLNTHDDDVPGKRRVAAYVFNLTSAWRAEWGGLLHFLRDPLVVSESWVPTFNVLNLLKVPQAHYVGMVTPLAPRDAARLSVTGWFRESA